jgi:hypothetical protein
LTYQTSALPFKGYQILSFFLFLHILVNILIGIHHPLSCRESPLTIRGNRRGQSDRAGAKELIAKQPLWNVFDLVFDLPTKIF